MEYYLKYLLINYILFNVDYILSIVSNNHIMLDLQTYIANNMNLLTILVDLTFAYYNYK